MTLDTNQIDMWKNFSIVMDFIIKSRSEVVHQSMFNQNFQRVVDSRKRERWTFILYRIKNLSGGRMALVMIQEFNDLQAW